MKTLKIQLKDETYDKLEAFSIFFQAMRGMDASMEQMARLAIETFIEGIEDDMNEW